MAGIEMEPTWKRRRGMPRMTWMISCELEMGAKMDTLGVTSHRWLGIEIGRCLFVFYALIEVKGNYVCMY